MEKVITVTDDKLSEGEEKKMKEIIYSLEGFTFNSICRILHIVDKNLAMYKAAKPTEKEKL